MIKVNYNNDCLEQLVILAILYHLQKSLFETIGLIIIKYSNPPSIVGGYVPEAHPPTPLAKSENRKTHLNIP